MRHNSKHLPERLPALAGADYHTGPYYKYSSMRWYCSGPPSSFEDTIEDEQEKYSKQVEQNPKSAEAHFMLGRAIYGVNTVDRTAEMVDKANLQFEEAAKLDPKCANSFYNIGSIEHERGNLDKAIFYYKKAAAILPNDPGILTYMGNAYQTAGNLDAALVAFEKVIATASEKDAWLSLRNAAHIYEKRGDTKKAEEYRRRAPKD